MSIVSEIDPGLGPSCGWSNWLGDGPATAPSSGWGVISARLRLTVLVLVAVMHVCLLPWFSGNLFGSSAAARNLIAGY